MALPLRLEGIATPDGRPSVDVGVDGAVSVLRTPEPEAELAGGA